MGQQFGDFNFDKQLVPQGTRPYDPNVSEVAYHVAVVMDELDKVEHAALQLRHIAIGELALAPK